MWLQRALGHRVDAGTADAAALALPAPWQRILGASGEPVWTWPADQPRPASLPLPTGGKPGWAFVDFDSVEPQPSALPVQLERKLWKLVPQHAAPTATPMRHPPRPTTAACRCAWSSSRRARRCRPTRCTWTRSTCAATSPLRHALVEAGLPPGASVEASTWGIDIESGADKVAPLERAQQQDIPQGYAVPIDVLAAGDRLVVRHLVRLAQRGQFNVPAARLHRMYDPDAKAVDTSGAWAHWDVK